MDNVFHSNHPLVKHKIARLRDSNTDPKLFRELVDELSQILVYEATRDLPLATTNVTSPMGATEGHSIDVEIGIVPILRAGLGMVQGALSLIPFAKVWHIGLKRNEETLQPEHYYANKPDAADNAVALVLDPMLATGGSAVAAVELLQSWGIQNIVYLGLLAAPEGVAHLQQNCPDVKIYLAQIDSNLNDIGYIVPGLGDAGDRQFGT